MEFWYREPIFVVPATVGVAFLLGIPFFVAGADGAAAFFGSFFAAITALLGVVVGAAMSANLERRRTDREKRTQVLAATRIARFELQEAKDYFGALRQSLPPNDNDATRAEAGTTKYHITIGVLIDYLKTPHLDKNLTELCLQSNEIARRALSFSASRNRLIRIHETLSVDAYAQAAGFTWGFFGSLLWVLEAALDNLVAELDRFVEQHAGEFA